MNAMKAQAALTRTLPFSNIDKRVLGIRFGAYGVRAVCTGIYEPGHETTDKNGFRQDALDYVRNLDMPIVH